MGDVYTPSGYSQQGLGDWVNRTSIALQIGGDIYNTLGRLTMSEGYWLSAKGQYNPVSLLERGANGKFVRGVQGYRNSYAGALKTARMFKWAGGVVTVATGGIEIGYGIYQDGGYGYNAQRATAGVAGGIGGSALGAWGGASAGAAIGAWFGGIGAIPGAIIGGIVGSIGGGWGGSYVGEAIYDGFFR